MEFRFSAILDMLHIVDEFQYLSERLSLNDDSALIKPIVANSIPLTRTYLQESDSFKNFADYLNKNGIEYEVYSNTYITE